jgi:hypothetical protein
LKLAPADYRPHWEWVRAGLVECIRRARSDYTPEDVWLSLRDRKAFLYLAQHAEEDLGFAVFIPRPPHLWVEALWTEHGAGKVWEQQLWAEVDRLKAENNFSAVRWKSGRKGWAKRARIVQYEYER